MANKKVPKSTDFCCQYCDFHTSRKTHYERHVETIKHTYRHNRLTTTNCLVQKVPFFICHICNKKYKHQSSLCKHKKICSDRFHPLDSTEFIQPTTTHPVLEVDKDMVMMLIKQNSELLEVVKQGTYNHNSNNTTHSHNKHFHLQFFLNETCKDAMNMMDFVESIQLQLSDLERIGEVGYVNGISNIIVKHLNNMDVTKRPVHCTDKKRETMYIKDNNKWEKEEDEKKNIRKCIKKIANKNIRFLQIFKQVHPDCIHSDSQYSDQYNKIIVESMGGSGDNDVEKEDKIIKRITKHVLIDKDLFPSI